VIPSFISNKKVTWGIVANSHDASLAVFHDHWPVFAALAKDFSGVANDPHLNHTLLSVAKEYGQPDEIVWYEYPRLKWLRQKWAGQDVPYSDAIVKNYLHSYGISMDCKLSFTKHHHSHAAYGWYARPKHTNAHWAIVVMDSIGEFETFTIWEGLGDRLKKVYSQGYPHSLGLWYSSMTKTLGFQPNAEEHMVSQLAVLGDPTVYKKEVDELFDITYPKVKFNANMHRGMGNWMSNAHKTDLAAAVQTKFEDIVLGISEWCKEELGVGNICFMGGCALNKPAIDKVRDTGMFEMVHVPKNPGDPGSCLGAVFAKTKTKVDIDDSIWYNKDV